MVEGLWIVQYEGMQGSGGGVVVFVRGKVFGGDSGTTYIGTYEVNGATIKTRVKVHSYMVGIPSIIGVEGDYELDVTGTIEGDVIKGSGRPIGHQTAGMALRLVKQASLPA
jgi:hypothetical protein